MKKIEMKTEDIFAALDQVAEQNFLTPTEANQIIEEAITKAFHTKFDPDAELTLIMDKKNNKFELINNSIFVVSDADFKEEHRAIEVPLSLAMENNPKAEVGDMIAESVPFSAYAQILAQAIRQMFTQQVREKKKEAIYAKHKSLKGEMIDVTVTSVTPKHAIFSLQDGTTAFMPEVLRNTKIPLSVGQRVSVYVEDVLEEAKESQIIVSNASKESVKRVIESEVPEIEQGIVEIVNIARRPGYRSKIAVKTANENIDPVGAIIGERGSRIKRIIEKLDGEKLDIVMWSADENVFVANSLAPAKAISVITKKDEKGEEKTGFKLAITPNRHQTLAIGKQGMNVKLASELTGLRIDVISIDQAKEKEMEIDWNTGLTQADVDTIESGERLAPKFNNRPQSQNNVNLDLDSEIAAFADDIINESKPVDNEPEIKIDEDLFTDEDLAAMQNEFDFDDELLDYQNEDDNDNDND